MTWELKHRRYCRNCGQYLGLIPRTSGKGRPRLYCSNRCRQAAYRARQEVKKEAAAADRWRRAIQQVDMDNIAEYYRQRGVDIPEHGIDDAEGENRRE